MQEFFLEDTLPTLLVSQWLRANLVILNSRGTCREIEGQLCLEKNQWISECVYYKANMAIKN